jgi:hypothetical protein
MALLQDAPAAAALAPAEFYRIVEAGILCELKNAARTITASTLHAFVRELVFGWVVRPDYVDDSEWFAPRPTTADADIGLEAYVCLFNPPPSPTPDVLTPRRIYPLATAPIPTRITWRALDSVDWNRQA